MHVPIFMLESKKLIRTLQTPVNHSVIRGDLHKRRQKSPLPLLSLTCSKQMFPIYLTIFTSPDIFRRF
jgi:hypothetical protein